MYKRVTTLCYVVVIGFLLLTQVGTAQKAHNLLSLKNGISKPYTQATHPFGVLLYSLPHNFKAHNESEPTLSLQLSSGNIWGQPVTAYIPTLESDRSLMQTLQFYSRSSSFQEEQNPSKSYTIAYDGVIKDIKISSTIPFGLQSDLTITLRSFILTKGKFPSSIITGDNFIEFFHSNITGGEDPFGRELVGLDQAHINYTDRNGNSVLISSGEFVFSGIETALYHYPKLFHKNNIYLNLGAHLGANMSSYNKSLDAGISIAGVKKFHSKRNLKFISGLGANILQKRLISFKPNQTDLGTSSFILSFEGHFEIYKKTRRNSYHSLGLNYRIQTPYNNKKEEEYYVPTSRERIKRWHDASRQLYRHPSYWSLIYSITKKTVFSIYLQQDMLVNNAPDLQTGISIKLPMRF